MTKRHHPMQEIKFDDHGVIRFRENKIVRFLLDQYKPGLNGICARFGQDKNPDYEQLMMLIGYSVSGFGDLSNVERRTINAADKKAKKLFESKLKESPSA